MSEQPGPDEEEFRRLLRDFLEGRADIDPAQLAGAAGLPQDPALLGQLMGQLQRAMQQQGDGIDWSVAAEQSNRIAEQGAVVTLPEERAGLEQAARVADLWLDEATELPSLPAPVDLLSRAEWTRATISVWTQLAEPVATSIADALTAAIGEAAPEELESLMPGASRMMRSVGGALFAMQLGQVVGQLSGEVLTGGDIGVPLLPEGRAAILPQNTLAFGRSLEQPIDQVQLWVAARELAHARLFRHARWLALQLITSITDYARGIAIDMDAFESIAEGLDPSRPEELRAALQDGRFIPPRSPAQQQALARLETTLALIEGWVDVVTADATRRLPAADAISEAVRRRRAAGGPAERALAALVGLELRPRRLREAAAMWRAVTEAVGSARRDALWSHPDVIPTAADIDDPAALIARLTAGPPAPDEVDRAIEDLLADVDGDRPIEGESRDES